MLTFCIQLALLSLFCVWLSSPLHVVSSSTRERQNSFGKWSLWITSAKSVRTKTGNRLLLYVVVLTLFPSVMLSPPSILQNEDTEALLVSKKPSKTRPTLAREKSADSSSTSSSASAEKQRQEARKRLLAAKKAASFRQNSATESADSIEIYVPEAQTRLWEKRTSKDPRTDKFVGGEEKWENKQGGFCLSADELRWVRKGV